MESRQQTRGERNCNPLNIKKTNIKWHGKIEGKDPIFETFKDCYYGYRAAIICLYKHYRTGSNTVNLLINKWAPSSENHTCNYVDYVSSLSSLAPNQVFIWSYSNVYFIMYHMCVFENGKIIDREALTKVAYEFFTK